MKNTPKENTPVLVYNSEYPHVAYYKEGKWHEAHTHEVLEGVTNWEELPKIKPQKEQLPIEWFAQKIKTNLGINIKNTSIGSELIKQTKKMEKEQMIEFADDFWFNCVLEDGSVTITPEQFYKETYEQ